MVPLAKIAQLNFELRSQVFVVPGVWQDAVLQQQAVPWHPLRQQGQLGLSDDLKLLLGVEVRQKKQPFYITVKGEKQLFFFFLTESVYFLKDEASVYVALDEQVTEQCIEKKIFL